MDILRSAAYCRVRSKYAAFIGNSHRSARHYSAESVTMNRVTFGKSRLPHVTDSTRMCKAQVGICCACCKCGWSRQSDNAELRDQKRAIPQCYEKSPLCTRHYSERGKIAQTAKTRVVWVSNNDVIENFDFKKLTSSNEVTGDFDVRFRRS